MKTEHNGIPVYLGKWRGRVSSTDNDPELKGSIRLYVPQVYGNGVESPPALACFASQHFDVPDLGDQVWVEFEQGDPSKPIYTGYNPSSKDGSRPAPLTAQGEEDITNVVGHGKGGGVVTVTDEDQGTKTILEPATLSKPSYPKVRELRVDASYIAVDGSEGAERVELYHGSGSFIEIGSTGAMRLVAKSPKREWVNGPSTTVITGTFTEKLSANHHYEAQSYRGVVEKNYNLTVKEDYTLTASGPMIVSGASYRREVLGRDVRIAGFVDDSSLGDRNQGTLGNRTTFITGADNTVIVNSGFATGQTVARATTIAAGDDITTLILGSKEIIVGSPVQAAALKLELLNTITGPTAGLEAAAVAYVNAPQVVLGASAPLLLGGAVEPAVMGTQLRLWLAQLNAVLTPLSSSLAALGVALAAEPTISGAKVPAGAVATAATTVSLSLPALTGALANLNSLAVSVAGLPDLTDILPDPSELAEALGLL